MMEEDWDTLIILDGCRYDTFESLNNIDGKNSKVVSGGSSTPEFINHNFRGKTYKDIVYVTANPHLRRQEVDGNFFETWHLWETDWDEELKTVRPEAVTEATLRAHQEFPEKRIVSHYMQPHYPFIGPTGRQIEQQGILDDKHRLSAWEQLRHNRLDKGLVEQAYRENLELVLREVRKVDEEVVGQIVVTADHGNSFGRFGVYGHPHGIFMPDLVVVPWLEIEGERRAIVPGESTANPDTESDIESRLSNLGYLS